MLWDHWGCSVKGFLANAAKWQCSSDIGRPDKWAGEEQNAEGGSF